MDSVVEKAIDVTEQVVPRKYWKAVVRSGERNSVASSSLSRVEWHAATCIRFNNDCAGCEP